jgi:serine/threonine protein kinase/class 3 adenylate cyclase/tetratricopeptide (TPR) repeat protein
VQLPGPFGKYELLERIATGGMAEVFLARSFGLAGFEKRVVVKKLREELADDPRFVNLFIAEAKIGVHLNHPNVVQVYELGRVGRDHYIAMEYLHGRDLTRLVKALRHRGRTVPLPLAVAIVADACRGLAYAHARTGPDGLPLGLVHRDVSPHNVVVTFTGDVKLVDFGIARLVVTTDASGSPARKPGPGGGKYAYMSPEQAAGGAVDHRSDIFSLGIVLWELLTGRRLYQTSDHEEKLRRVREAVVPHPSSLGAPVDDGLWRILAQAMAPSPDDRFQSAAAFEEELRAWLFENRMRVARAEIAALVRVAFPEEADRPPGSDASLQQLVADVDRLDPALPRPAPTMPPTMPRSRAPGAVTPAGAGGEHRPVVVLMIDVDGLTELSETVGPEMLAKRRYQLLRFVRPIVDRHGGHLQSAVDDQITIFFGVPRTRVDDAAHALECALELVRGVGQLRRKGMMLELAIGVHSGEVTVGQAGRKIRYTARGDTTRLARRLSSVADHGQVLVSDRVLASVHGWFRVRRGPDVMSRGGRGHPDSWLVEGRSHGLRGTFGGSWLRRGRELDQLRAALMMVGNGRGTALALTGDIGCGKSRFIREIRELAARRGTTFLGVRCTALGTERPLEPLRDLVATVLGVDPEAPVIDLQAAAEQLAPLGLSSRDLDSIATLLGKRPVHAPEKGETWQAVTRLLRALGRERPLIVAFDDAHALPADQVGDLAHLVRSLQDLPVLVLLAFRPPVPLPLREVCEVVTLPALDRDQQLHLAETLLGVKEVDGPVLALLERTCEGNALYLEEMLEYLVATDRVTLDGEKAVLAAKADLKLPHSLLALLSARIDALDSASRGILQLAAVAGSSFTLPLLAEAAGLPDPQPLVLDLLAHGLVVRAPGTDSYEFASDLVREAVLRGTLGIQRRDYHRLVAHAIEAVYAGRLEPHLEALVTHCAEGGRLVDAARYAHQAGRILEQQGFLERARVLYVRGLETLRSGHASDDMDARVQGEAMLELRLGVVHLLLANHTEGHRRLHVALDIANEAGLGWIEAQAHVALGRSLLQEGRAEVASAHLTQARELLRIDPDPKIELETVEALATLAYEEGRNVEAEALWQRALELAKDDPAAFARCQIGLANRYLRSGDHDRAQELLEQALASSRAAADRILEGRVLNNIGLLHSWAGRHAEALRYYRAALELREGIGYSRGVVVNHHNIGDVHFHQGEHAKAWVAFERSRAIAEEIGWDRGVSLNDVFLAYLSSNNGGVDSILAATDRARTLGDAEVVATGLWLAGRWLSERGRDAEAKAQLAAAMTEAGRFELKPMVDVIQETLLQIERRSADADHLVDPPRDDRL